MLHIHIICYGLHIYIIYICLYIYIYVYIYIYNIYNIYMSEMEGHRSLPFGTLEKLLNTVI